MVDGQPVRGRKNRWGVVNVENEAHCDFNYLRNFLTRCVLFPLPADYALQDPLTSRRFVQYAPARSDRDDLDGPLRGVPIEATARYVQMPVHACL